MIAPFANTRNIAARLRLTLLAVLTSLALAAPVTPASAEATPMDWSSIVAKVLPSVVNISVETLAPKDGAQQRQQQVGTGFLIDPSGTIVTNKHVIAGAFRITVTLFDQSQWHAKVLAAAQLLDLAVLKIDVGHPLPFLKFANSDRVRIGDPVIVVGNPLGLGTSVSSGIVSALHRDLSNTPIDDYIQTDAAINHGNSGGPVLDRDGQVLGVATILVTAASGEGSNGLGFAIASREAQYAVQHLLHPDIGSVGWIGVHVQDVTPPLQRAFHLQNPGGSLITQIDDDSPAYDFGLQVGDVIIRYGDITPENSRALIEDISVTPANQTVPITVERGGKIVTVDVTVTYWPDLAAPLDSVLTSMQEAAAASPPDFGLVLSPMTGAATRLYKLTADSGVVVAAVDPASDAFTAGISPGDVIERVDNMDVDSPEQVLNAMQKAEANDRFVALLIAKKDSKRWVALYSGNTGRPEEKPPPATASADPQPAQRTSPQHP
ncbi:MAG: trypsin-like peptidase domain-containing protein [Acetobacteraceae bacterium]|nr:trypsin-like peptidase domain-containing protein [Acetobacteraceae bacterium]